MALSTSRRRQAASRTGRAAAQSLSFAPDTPPRVVAPPEDYLLKTERMAKRKGVLHGGIHDYTAFFSVKHPLTRAGPAACDGIVPEAT